MPAFCDRRSLLEISSHSVREVSLLPSESESCIGISMTQCLELSDAIACIIHERAVVGYLLVGSSIIVDTASTQSRRASSWGLRHDGGKKRR